MNIEEEVSRALNELAVSVRITGPIRTENHTNYIVAGLSGSPEQMMNLCWCILGFIGGIYEIDLSIDSAIGEGTKASDNLVKALEKRLGVNKTRTKRQKELNRDPLLQELISHVLVLVHQRQQILTEWLGEIQSCRPPHLSANDSGLDLIAIGVENGSPFPVIGEVKAYETDPLEGFATACGKFTQVSQGEYNDEIREAMKKGLDIHSQFTKEQLADNIWIEIGRFGALVGYDQQCNLRADECCSKAEVLCQDCDRLFLIASPYASMRELFDALCDRLVVLAKRLGE